MRHESGTLVLTICSEQAEIGPDYPGRMLGIRDFVHISGQMFCINRNDGLCVLHSLWRVYCEMFPENTWSDEIGFCILALP